MASSRPRPTRRRSSQICRVPGLPLPWYRGGTANTSWRMFLHGHGSLVVFTKMKPCSTIDRGDLARACLRLLVPSARGGLNRTAASISHSTQALPSRTTLRCLQISITMAGLVFIVLHNKTTVRQNVSIYHPTTTLQFLAVHVHVCCL